MFSCQEFIMKIIRLSSKGQVTIPKAMRVAHNWDAGQELVAIEIDNGVLLKPKKAFPKTTLEQVAGCLAYSGQAKDTDSFAAAIEQGVIVHKNDGCY